MTGRRSHGRLSALNGVVHQGIYEARHPTFLPGGEAARPWDATTGARVRRPRRRRCSWQRLVAHRSHDPDVAWLINGLAAQSGIEPSGP